MTSEEKGYNGWRNYETWAVKLWMDNEKPSYRYWEATAQEMLDEAVPGDYEWQTRNQQAAYALAQRLRDEIDWHENESIQGIEGTMWADLLGAALSEVDWTEIAEALLEDKTPSDAGVEEDEDAEV